MQAQDLALRATPLGTSCACMAVPNKRQTTVLPMSLANVLPMSVYTPNTRAGQPTDLIQTTETPNHQTTKPSTRSTRSTRLNRTQKNRVGDFSSALSASRKRALKKSRTPVSRIPFGSASRRATSSTEESIITNRGRSLTSPPEKHPPSARFQGLSGNPKRT